ncbi:MAG: hypothetical protein K2N49_04360 [Ruminococcus sp.]|nr:hypothetical protein [Ruminococcus sp.]MDE7226074.1 hypothetical protein [Ruminococcus sp.]
MMKKFGKFLRYTGIILILSEILYVIRTAIDIYITMSRYGSASGIGIIGGADSPTAVYLLKNLGFFDMVVFIVGIVCIIISAIILHEKKQK